MGPEAPDRVASGSLTGRFGTRGIALFAVLLAVAFIGAIPAGGTAQRINEFRETRFRAVMPNASRFGEVDDLLPVIPAYGVDGGSGAEVLIGYVFHTADLPPERIGYNGPIETLVGLDLNGRITGARITDYWESHRSSLGDFLRTGGTVEQFAGKHMGDPFRVPGDVDGISRATISVRALARGIRDSARRVADAYLDAPVAEVPLPEDLTSLTWLELVRSGVVQRFAVSNRSGAAEVSLIYPETDAFAEHLVGGAALASAQRSLQARDEPGHLLLYGVEGSRLRLFVRSGWSVVQDGDTVPVPPTEVRSFGLSGAGLMAEQVTLTGSMIVAGTIDMERPFRVLFRQPADTTYALEYRTLAARSVPEAVLGLAEDVSSPAKVGSGLEPADAEDEARIDLEVDPEGETQGGPADDPAGDRPELDADPEAPSDESVVPVESNESTEPPESGSAGPPDPEVAPGLIPPAATSQVPPESAQPLFGSVYEGTVLGRLVESASPFRLGLLFIVLMLGTAAFFLKSLSLRWFALATTLVLLGFVDGGFLSVSHITSGIWTRGESYTADLPLLIFLVFAVVTTVIWGRVFCGFLCPFGALQDLLERLVPDRFKRTPLGRPHRAGLLVKYGVLGAVLIPVLMGNRTSLYQYVEPFGTVFLQSPSLLLWAIALIFLGLSAVIPRFYCRYVCPLGAALALGSMVSLRRIPRVEHCQHCRVCEQACPTGAIQGPEIDFKECVRCNVCEIKLRERAGVCGHDIGEVRERLVQIRVPASA